MSDKLKFITVGGKNIDFEKLAITSTPASGGDAPVLPKTSHMGKPQGKCKKCGRPLQKGVCPMCAEKADTSYGLSKADQPKFITVGGKTIPLKPSEHRAAMKQFKEKQRSAIEFLRDAEDWDNPEAQAALDHLQSIGWTADKLLELTKEKRR
jgi:hypothetical protein